MISFELNGKKVAVDVPGETPLLWVLREELGMTGTKFGCGKGLCGACTISLSGQPTRICILPVAAVEGQKVKTIEDFPKEKPHPVQKAWIKHNVPQCGYCQSGQIMKAIALLEQKGSWTKSELLQQMDGNVCRCGTYQNIRTALMDAAKEMGKIR